MVKDIRGQQFTSKDTVTIETETLIQAVCTAIGQATIEKILEERDSWEFLEHLL